MTKPAHVSDLFDPPPGTWGGRGDPYLWADMRDHFAGVECPGTADELAASVEAMFLRLTGMPMSHPEGIHLEKYAHGGMSSGVVWPPFWREDAIPLLRSRLEKSLAA